MTEKLLILSAIALPLVVWGILQLRPYYYSWKYRRAVADYGEALEQHHTKKMEDD